MLMLYAHSFCHPNNQQPLDLNRCPLDGEVLRRTVAPVRLCCPHRVDGGLKSVLTDLQLCCKTVKSCGFFFNQTSFHLEKKVTMKPALGGQREPVMIQSPSRFSKRVFCFSSNILSNLLPQIVFCHHDNSLPLTVGLMFQILVLV